MAAAQPHMTMNSIRKQILYRNADVIHSKVTQTNGCNANLWACMPEGQGRKFLPARGCKIGSDRTV